MATQESTTAPTTPTEPVTAPAAPVTPPVAPAATEPAPEAPKGGQAAVLADLARERDRRQALEAEVAELRKSQMTDAEKALTEAEERGRKAAEEAARPALAAALLQAALTGHVADPAAFVGDLNVTKFIGADGALDVVQVEALKSRLPVLDAPRFTGGANNGARPPQEPKSWQESADAAVAAGDTKTSLALKASALVAMSQNPGSI